MEYRDILEKIIGGNDLSGNEMKEIMGQLMSGNLTEAQIGGFLTALRMKGESIDELSAGADVMRSHAIRIDTGIPVVDTCGTGGDGAKTFNISTAAAFIAAGAGITIAKHGNRSVSSKCGSADVMEALGIKVDIPPSKVCRCIQKVGIGFLFAPKLHPAMKQVIKARKELGIRTFFNLLGPLTNPAYASSQVIGVFSPELTEIFSKILRNLGTKRAFVVHGMDGLDEISITEKTKISHLQEGEIKTFLFDPFAFLRRRYSLEELQGKDAAENAKLIRSILRGDGPEAPTEISIINAAAAIFISKKRQHFTDSVKIARQSIASGNAFTKLEELVKETNL